MRNTINIAIGIIVIVASLAGLYAFEATARELPRNESGEYPVMVNVESQRKDIPDPMLMTHLFYSFAEITPTFDNIEIANLPRFEEIVKLKEVNPDLKIVLVVGGYKREGFSEMASSSRRRKKFAKACREAVVKYNLDGIDLDWEFPTTEAGGHTARPDDDRNYALVMKELRKQLGKDKILSFYSNNSGKWINFPLMLPWVDYVIVSGYNLQFPPRHQCNLYPSKKAGNWCVDKAVKRHIELGVPPEKILLGIGFFARTVPMADHKNLNYMEHPFSKYMPGYEEQWDDDAKVPYYADADGNIVAAFDNERSLRLKCDYVKDMGLAGVSVWNYDADKSGHTLSKTLLEELKDNPGGRSSKK